MVLDPSHFSIIETLRNGRTVEIRAQRPHDREDLEAAIARMSDESLYRRFFGARRHFSQKEAEYFLNINFVDQVALVVVAEENGKQCYRPAWARGGLRPRRSALLARLCFPVDLDQLDEAVDAVVGEGHDAFVAETRATRESR